MSRKSKHKSKKREKFQKAAPQRLVKSSWGAAAKSFLKKFFLNHGVVGYHHDFEEDLNEEGLWKKKLIWAPHLLIAAVVLAVFPFCCKEFFATETARMGVFVFLVFEVTAIGMGIGGIMKIKDAIKIRSENKAKRK